MKRGVSSYFGAIAIVALLSFLGASPASAAVAPNLANASTFAVLSGSTAPGEAGVATQAQIDVLNAYTFLGSQLCTQSLSGVIGNSTVTPGVACISSTSTFANPVTLDAQNNAGGVFVIRVPGSITFSPSSSFPLANGANGNNVYFRVDGSATIGANAVVNGTIIANGSVTIDPAARVNGHVFSLNGQVIAPAGTVSCTGCITNHPTLTINKTVINDNGGIAVPADFELLINDMGAPSGRVNLLSPGTYTVGELVKTGYTSGVIGGACATNGFVSLSLGENKVCTIVNNDVGGGVGFPNTGAVAPR